MADKKTHRANHRKPLAPAMGASKSADSSRPGAGRQAEVTVTRQLRTTGEVSRSIGQGSPGVTKRRSIHVNAQPQALLGLRVAFILLLALLVSGTTGVLTYLISASVPGAILAAGPAFAAAITFLNSIVG